MSDWHGWWAALPDIAFSGVAGALGAVVRETTRTDRQFGLPLLWDALCAIPLAWVAAGAATSLGVDDPRALIAVGTGAGLAGKAAILDLCRAWLRSRLPTLPPDHPVEPADAERLLREARRHLGGPGDAAQD